MNYGNERHEELDMVDGYYIPPPPAAKRVEPVAPPASTPCKPVEILPVHVDFVYYDGEHWCVEDENEHVVADCEDESTAREVARRINHYRPLLEALKTANQMIEALNERPYPHDGVPAIIAANNKITRDAEDPSQ